MCQPITGRYAALVTDQGMQRPSNSGRAEDSSTDGCHLSAGRSTSDSLEWGKAESGDDMPACHRPITARASAPSAGVGRHEHC